MAAYYNEIDSYAAQWLRNLIAAGHIAPGDVDDRSIEDVRSDDLVGYHQCHFFAGVGVWSYALRCAGWPDDRPVWTGSCPCQPFSQAGKGGGYADERHLWPHWHRLIRERRPSIIFGEQVAAAIRTGWLDDVCLSLEKLEYAVGAIDLPACGVGAPHIRQRVYFVADNNESRLYNVRGGNGGPWRTKIGIESSGAISVVGNADNTGLEGWRHDIGEYSGQCAIREAGFVNGFWSDAEWLECLDGKARPVEPGTFPLAHGATARVGRLRAYGNAIVAPQAAEFIKAFMECRP